MQILPLAQHEMQHGIRDTKGRALRGPLPRRVLSDRNRLHSIPTSPEHLLYPRM
jgi:hypothetical protein